jgi:methionyl-tRNA formyltransferase
MAAPQKPLAVVFMGTPPFAATVLEHLLAWEGCVVRGVWCRPDRPSGRGHKPASPAVTLPAQRRGLPVFQPADFKAVEQRDALAACAPDVLVTAAYGLVLPQAVLDIPRLAPLNVHASLLPRYRGAAPIQRAIMDGCEHTGVSIMHMDAGLDTGPVYAMREMEIGEHTGGSLHDSLAHLGGALLVEVLAALANGGARAVPQSGVGVSYAPKLSKADGKIDWNASAYTVHAQIRAVTPWPGAHALLSLPPREEGGAIRELSVRFAPGKPGGQRPVGVPAGSLWLGADGVLGMVCRDGLYEVSSLRPADRSDMSATEFVCGFLAPGAHGVCGRTARVP